MEYKQRLQQIRDVMKEQGITYFFDMTSDPHSSEYLNEYYKTLRWLTGFTGSNAVIIVTQTEALLWTDSRYFIQAEKQISEEWKLMKMRVEGYLMPNEYLIQHLTEKDVLGFNHKIIPYHEIFKVAKEKKTTPFIDCDLYSFVYPREFIMKPVKEFLYHQESVKYKIERIRKLGEEVVLLTGVDDIMSLFNIRGDDVKMTPVAFSYAIIKQNETFLFIGTEEMTKEIQQFEQLKEAEVQVLPYNTFYESLKIICKGKKVVYDFYTISYISSLH